MLRGETFPFRTRSEEDALSRELNKVQVTGRLGADPELRCTEQGHTVATFRIASNRSWRTAEGETHEDTEWFRIVAWNKLAAICHHWLAKGSRVYVEGRLQTRQWQDQAGQSRSTTEVIASDVIILGGRREQLAPAAVPDAPPIHSPMPPSIASPNVPKTMVLPQNKKAFEEQDIPM